MGFEVEAEQSASSGLSIEAVNRPIDQLGQELSSNRAALLGVRTVLVVQGLERYL